MRFEAPMLILIALICAAYLIVAQAVGVPTFIRPKSNRQHR